MNPTNAVNPGHPTATACQALFAWVLRKGKGLTPETLTGTTPLLEGRHVTSLQIPELILYLEHLRGEPIDVMAMKAGDFRDLDTICTRFLDHTDARPAAR